MRIQPRKEILGIWQSLLEESYRDSKWRWGGRLDSNPISDAEQLLCLLHPITQIDTFQVHNPDVTQSDVLAALEPLGDAVNIPRKLVEISLEYFANHTAREVKGKDAVEGEPLFGSGAYLTKKGKKDPEPTEQQLRDIELVDSYSMSITLCLSLLVFAHDRRDQERVTRHKTKLDDLQRKASRRLTAAMVGMLRSFVVNSVTIGSDAGQAILGMLRQGQVTDADLQQSLKDRFGRMRQQLNSDVRLGVPDNAKPEDEELFECGWTWGIAQGAKPITDPETNLKVAVQAGYAQPRPWLYFTVSALDGIVDLTSRRVRSLDILDDQQRRLADALSLRWDLTQRYWSAVARFDPERWPLEDIPWRTSDGEESDYYSLLVVSVLIQDLVNRTATDADLVKAVGIIEELAVRGRITRRMTEKDAALLLHYPGVRQGLVGSEALGSRLTIYTSDFTPMIIKRSLQAAQLTDNVEAREKLVNVAQAAMDHLSERRLRSDGQVVTLWDDLRHLPGIEDVADGERFDTPSWYLTERVVEALVATAVTYSEEPPRSTRMYDHLLRLLYEADHVYNQELLQSDIDGQSRLRARLDEVGQLIARARAIQHRRTSTAIALAERALRLLDSLDEANDDARRSGSR